MPSRKPTGPADYLAAVRNAKRTRARLDAEAARRHQSTALMSRAPTDLETKVSQTASVYQTWKEPPPPVANYEKVSREGYGSNEIIFACIEELATSAAEPVIRAYTSRDDLAPDDHPILELLRKPNPFLTGYDLIASMLMFRSLAGNAYIEMVLNNGHTHPVELWLIRPDRMTVNPDPVTTISGYTFRFGNVVHTFPVEEIGHYKTRNPLSQLYGLAPMSVILARADTDNFAREFTKAFFFNAGVPSTLLAFKNLLDEEERALMQNRFNRNYSGAPGWHGVMVTESQEVEVKQLGMPMGARGIAYPELDEINEARLAMVFGVPLTLIGARLGQKSSSYANRLSDREMFWNETLVPIYRELEASFNQWLVPWFPDIDHLQFDLTTVNAFQDETDVLHARTRNDMAQSMLSWRESRKRIGIEEDPDLDDIMLVPSNLIPMKVRDFLAAVPPVPAATTGTPGGADKPNENGHSSQPYIAKPSLNGNGAKPGVHA